MAEGWSRHDLTQIRFTRASYLHGSKFPHTVNTLTIEILRFNEPAAREFKVGKQPSAKSLRTAVFLQAFEQTSISV